ncbi:hypothetical protein N7468_002377 [Penicillium chermesinum]|uniref:SHSP domain-containing protein n=1 Tax=Penicillium chermesinum TaxID=63820 RepID=A0A9W9PIM5_9EURO|nr:uncharacterized protein N7468_002377 [Penicillium chermesinum]KAJ5247394.1 hypothetical protein N7468_002377 [Penicillium chermesinum]KAJ6145636.1 hypothetical protein N7470_009531 [Penicillium chermesinum]
MASIYHLNNPPNPWESLLTGLEDHPFFAGRGHHGGRHHHHGPPPPPFFGWGGPAHHGHHHPGPHPFWGMGNNEAAPEDSQKPHNAEPTPGPSTEKTPQAEQEKANADNDNEDDHPRRCGKGKQAHGKHAGGRCRGRGMGGRGGWGRGGWGRPHPYAGHRGRGHHRGFGSPGAPDFDFLRQLASRCGFPMPEPSAGTADFAPVVDVFDAPTQYIVHVSLPGAKKEDLSIDYDTDESVLRLAGVVYRPGVDENLHQALVMEERGREVGVFEREIRLGTSQAPAAVLADEISAKLEDGVLNVTIPKILVEAQPEPNKTVYVEDLNEKSPSKTVTPAESEMSDYDDEEEEAKEYVKVPVQ